MVLLLSINSYDLVAAPRHNFGDELRLKFSRRETDLTILSLPSL